MFVFGVTTGEEDHEMADRQSHLDEGYSDKLLKPRSRSFDKPKVYRPRKLRTASLDLGTPSVSKKRLDRSESWETESYFTESKVSHI